MHCRCITTVQWARTSYVYKYIILIHEKRWTKSTNDALPQGSFGLDAGQKENIKNLKRQEKEEKPWTAVFVAWTVQRYNKYAECDGNDRH